MEDFFTTTGAQSLPLLLCLSHLRWDFVFQRPQHLLTRAAAIYQVVYFEEPCFPEEQGGLPRLEVRRSPEGVLVATPLLPGGLDAAAVDGLQRQLLDGLLLELAAPLAVAWFYTPMALDFARHLRPAITVYDCMDELSLFQGASPRLALLERRLLRQAELVFTGGPSLHEAKRRLHPQAHLFCSSVDAGHFRRARSWGVEPADQGGLARPRIGFFGVLDERMDYGLIEAVAGLRPGWQLVMIGPTAKIDPGALPDRPNLHWLGMKPYAELPAYLGGWDAGLMPFALNEATRFISPTKTPEFLAAGVPLVSTPVPDVVREWGKNELVEIAEGPAAVVAAIERVLARPRGEWQDRVDQYLAGMSWDATWARMARLIARAASDARSSRAAGSVTRTQPGAD